jgi:hypothetical protein
LPDRQRGFDDVGRGDAIDERWIVLLEEAGRIGDHAFDTDRSDPISDCAAEGQWVLPAACS